MSAKMYLSRMLNWTHIDPAEDCTDADTQTNIATGTGTGTMLDTADAGTPMDSEEDDWENVIVSTITMGNVCFGNGEDQGLVYVKSNGEKRGSLWNVEELLEVLAYLCSANSDKDRRQADWTAGENCREHDGYVFHSGTLNGKWVWTGMSKERTVYFCVDRTKLDGKVTLEERVCFNRECVRRIFTGSLRELVEIVCLGKLKGIAEEELPSRYLDEADQRVLSYLYRRTTKRFENTAANLLKDQPRMQYLKSSLLTILSKYANFNLSKVPSIESILDSLVFRRKYDLAFRTIRKPLKETAQNESVPPRKRTVDVRLAGFDLECESTNNEPKKPRLTLHVSRRDQLDKDIFLPHHECAIKLFPTVRLSGKPVILIAAKDRKLSLGSHAARYLDTNDKDMEGLLQGKYAAMLFQPVAVILEEDQ